ncbi:MAG TPA: glutamine-hydrolyzing carbamoyl-phosphate synthase small subunit [Nitrososphaerales archaeon]|nr:glutamine-hydrolyzing carbamoyl-phosphate synthase small subunit [Nitrososphaerales archaeon]
MPRTSKEALLMLEDGSLFFGSSFGAEFDTIGEVVFNTGMVGYPESMTDPSYSGQILCFTYPLIGNYGVPAYENHDEFGLPRFFESSRIRVKGIVVQEACDVPSHWASRRTLSEWLESEGIPGIEGVDTRALVTKLRESGVMMGVLSIGREAHSSEHLAELLRTTKKYSSQNLVAGVSVSKPVIHGDSEKRIVLLDCGTKYGIIRNLLKRGFQVVRLPYDASYSTVMKHDPVGVVVCNGPGDPELLTGTARCVASLVDSEVPLLGVCLGEQVVGMSQGAKTFKLKYGHRGQNKPCIDLTNGLGYVTSQNHGYAIHEKSLATTELKPWFINADDRTVEGVFHQSKPCMAVQFHPEATPGPYDTMFVFDRFMDATMGERQRGEEFRSLRA